MTLAAFRSPSAVAVVGASDDATKWGNWLARGALAGAGRRRVYFVNTRGGSVLGQPAFRSLRDLPESPELVTFAVPGRSLPAAVDDALVVGSWARSCESFRLSVSPTVRRKGAPNGSRGGCAPHSFRLN